MEKNVLFHVPHTFRNIEMRVKYFVVFFLCAPFISKYRDASEKIHNQLPSIPQLGGQGIWNWGKGQILTGGQQPSIPYGILFKNTLFFVSIFWSYFYLQFYKFGKIIRDVHIHIHN